MVKKRSIALAIIFTLITCGIYGIYWFIVLTEDMKTLTPQDEYQTSGGLAFVLSLITCGIYGLYWDYKMGQKVDQLKGSSNTGIIYIILHVIGLEIINMALMQDTVNHFATEEVVSDASYIEHDNNQ